MATGQDFHLSRAIEAHYGEIRTYAQRKVRSAAAADDLAQEACLRLASVDARRIGNPRAFLYRVVTNLIIDHRRREKALGRHLVEGCGTVEAIDETPDAERRLVAKQRLSSLSQAIAELPPRCRECFVLRRFEDMDADAIARRMGISRNMVEKHLRHALTQCVNRLRDDD